MFAIDGAFLATRDRRADGLCNGVQIVLFGGSQRDAHLVVPCLCDKNHCVAFAIQQRSDARIVFD